MKQAPGKRARHGPPSPRKTGLGIHSPSIGLPLQPSASLDPAHKASTGPTDASIPLQSQPVNLQSPSSHDAAPTSTPQAPQPDPAAVAAPLPSAASGFGQLTSQSRGPTGAAGASSTSKTEPAAGGATQLQGAGHTGGTEPSFTAQPMQHDIQTETGSAAIAMQMTEGAPVQHGLGQRAGGEAPPPKPQRTLWHPHTEESLSGWKTAVSAAHAADQQAAPGQGVSHSLISIA